MNGRTYLSFQEEDSYFFQIFFINFDSSLACLFSHSHLYQRNNSVADSTWSGASSYLAPTLTDLVPDPTWAGATDRLHYHSLLPFVFGANP